MPGMWKKNEIDKWAYQAYKCIYESDYMNAYTSQIIQQVFLTHMQLE